LIIARTMRFARAGVHEGRAVEFRAALDALPAHARDAWLDRVLGVDALLDDGPDLPAGCAPYLPCPVDLLLLMLELARVGPGDVFVDLGSGTGRATALAHLLTGAGAIGIEVQAGLAEISRAMTQALGADRVSTIVGDAAELVASMSIGTVFFLYCPFSGARLERVLDALQSIAVTRPIRICCVHLPPLARPWLEPVASPRSELAIYRSTIPRSVDALGGAAEGQLDLG
jgi:SAM-dependent methyltransferase